MCGVADVPVGVPVLSVRLALVLHADLMALPLGYPEHLLELAPDLEKVGGPGLHLLHLPHHLLPLPLFLLCQRQLLPDCKNRNQFG